MVSCGRAMDNVFTERLWRSIKYEVVYLKDYASPREACKELTEYLLYVFWQFLHFGEHAEDVVGAQKGIPQHIWESLPESSKNLG